MPEESAEDDPESETDTESKGNGKKSFRPRWLSDTVGGWSLLTLGTVLTICGAALLSSHRQPFFTAWSLILSGISCFGGVAYFWLSNHRKKQSVHKMPKWLPTMSCVGIIAVGALAFGVAAWQEIADRRSSIPIVKTPLPAWLPPEMSADCKIAYALVLDGVFKIDLEEVKKHNNEFPVPGTVFTVRIKDRRLFVDVPNALEAEFADAEWPSNWADLTNQNTHAFSDVAYLDQKLRPGLDRNYSTNAVEIVGPDPDFVPMFQCIYERPNAVRINGILQFVKKGDKVVWGAYQFGEKNFREFLFKDRALMSHYLRFLGTNRMFKYPSYKYLGEYADMKELSVTANNWPSLHPIDDSAFFLMTAIMGNTNSSRDGPQTVATHCSVLNVGGIAASNLQAEWKIIDIHSSQVMAAFTSRWDGAILPGDWRTAEGGISKNAIFEGYVIATLRYKDVLQHDYWISFHVVPTNNYEFYIEPFAKGGYFNELTDDYSRSHQINGNSSHGDTDSSGKSK